MWRIFAVSLCEHFIFRGLRLIFLIVKKKSLIFHCNCIDWKVAGLQSAIFGGLSWGFRLLWWGCIPQDNCMKNRGKTSTLNSRENFLKFYSISIGWLPTITSWKNLEGVSYKEKVTSHCMRHTVLVHYQPKIIEVNSHLNITKLKLPVPSVLTHHKIGKFHTFKICTSPTYCPR